MKTKTKDLFIGDKVFIYLAIITFLILSFPFVAMQYSSEVKWTLFDFMITGTLTFGTGFIFIHLSQITPKKYHMITGLVFLAVILVIFIHLAVGIVDTWPLAGS